MVNATFAYVFTPRPLFGMQKIFASVLHFCDIDHEHFCAKPLFRPMKLFEKVPAWIPVTKGLFFIFIRQDSIVSRLPSPLQLFI